MSTQYNDISTNKNYETVFIIDPTFAGKDVNDIINSVKSFITDNKGQIIEHSNIGSMKLAYEINGKSNGIYNFIEFTLNPCFIKGLETLYRRNESILRSIVCGLDKHGVEYNSNRRKNRKKIINNQKILSLI